MDLTPIIQNALMGRGQKASELPDNYQCFTEAEVEGIVREVLLRYDTNRLNESMQNAMGGINA